jgi:NAD+ diphosphatase
MIACVAEAEGGALTIDRDELEDARWFTREEVREAVAGSVEAAFIAPPPFAIAHSLLAHWLAA